MVPQLSAEAAKAAEQMGGAIKDTLTTTFSVFIVAKFLFGVSLKKVWSLLLTLQVMLFILLKLS